ncbi:CgeB family protein [Bradyrhizobium sp. HKCCYLS2038]|uniref:CgeB family protein n=1 Tax=unclassified Bradyrhizobium TaxID=2631580 RepID=UPI003EB7B1BB
MKILCVLSRYAYGRPERGDNYDYVHFVPAWQRMGHEVEVFDSGDRSRFSDFAALNRALVETVVLVRPDIVFCVLMHYEIWSETLDLIRTRTPAHVVNWGTDDSWKFGQASRFFARHVDLHVTTDRTAAERATALGLRNVLLSQWAASETILAEPLLSSDCQYDISFVGSQYGYRGEWIAALRAAGLTVACFGHGSEHGVVAASEIPKIHRASRIALNFSGAGQRGAGGSARQIKARVFEVPGAGGFLLTETAPGLDAYYVPGAEVGVFDTPEDLVAKCRSYLAQAVQRDAIAQAGHQRTVAQHTYGSRFREVLQRLTATDDSRPARSWQLSADALDDAVRRHRQHSGLGWLRWCLVAPLTALFGPQRGPRAARRLLFECSWRLVGARTYRAGGLAGRLFYAES